MDGGDADAYQGSWAQREREARMRKVWLTRKQGREELGRGKFEEPKKRHGVTWEGLVQRGSEKNEEALNLYDEYSDELEDQYRINTFERKLDSVITVAELRHS